MESRGVGSMAEERVATAQLPQYTVVIACHPAFDEKFSNAVQTTRLGYCHGFPSVGVSAALVRYRNLIRYAETVPNPIFWLTYDDYRYLSDKTLKFIKGHRHIIQINTWFDGMEELHQGYNVPSPTMEERTLKRILASGPDFVWCSAPEAYFHSYENWIEVAGLKLVSLPWACDVARYYPCPSHTEFSDVEVAFVGGYRKYKEPQYVKYLRPYEDRLGIWGYSEWPSNFPYRGYLDNDQEKWLYQNARVCPTISEPQFAVTGDTVERPFKIMGCKGLTIMDNQVYTHLFEPSEALIPDSIEMYYQMMDAMLKDPDLNRKYRIAGYRAVWNRHTYRERARKIMLELGL